MRKHIGLAMILGITALTGCSDDGDDEARVEDFCEVTGDFFSGMAARNEAADGRVDQLGMVSPAFDRVASQDLRQPVELLETVDPPDALTGVWEPWLEQLEGLVAMQHLDASLPWSEEPGAEIGRFWLEQCSAADPEDREADNVSDPLREAIDEASSDQQLEGLDEAPDGGTIEVADEGFTTWTQDVGREPRDFLSYGIIVENTSDHIAVNTRVRVGAVDESGQTDMGGGIDPHGSGVMGGDDSDFHIPVLHPGERFGIGATEVDPPELVELAIEVEETGWWPADDRAVELGEINVSDIRTRPTDPPNYSGGLGLTVDSSYPAPVTQAHIYSVFRDAEGGIIGGGWYPFQEVVRPGQSFVEIQQRHGFPLPGDVDNSLTEAYL